MNPAGRVEPAAVPPVDERGQDGCTGRTGQTFSRAAPRRLGVRAVPQRAVRHFSGRKHDEHAAAAQPRLRGPQARQASRGRLGAVERIDEKAQVLQLRDAGEHRVGEQAHVRTNPPDERGQCEAVNGAARVIADDDERAARGNALDFEPRRVNPHIQRPQDARVE